MRPNHLQRMFPGLRRTACALAVALPLAVAGAGTGAAHADGVGGSTISHECAASGNISLGLPATHGACVAGGLPVNHNDAFVSSYCSNFTYPGPVLDPISGNTIFLTSRGQCLQYVNQTY